MRARDERQCGGGAWVFAPADVELELVGIIGRGDEEDILLEGDAELAALVEGLRAARAAG